MTQSKHSIYNELLDNKQILDWKKTFQYLLGK